MERLKGGIYISPRDLQILNDYSMQRARAEHRAVRDALGLTKSKLTVKAYCDYYGIEYDLVISYLNPFR